jgi:hypothetical protein
VSVTSVSNPKARIPLPKEVEREFVRRELLRLFAESRRYKQIVAQDLRPLWNALRRYDEVLAMRPAFGEIGDRADDQEWEEAEYGTPRDQSLARYVGKLRSVVSDAMGLMWKGALCEWAADFVHVGIVGSAVPLFANFGLPMMPAFAYPSPAEAATLEITVSHSHARLRTRTTDESANSERVQEIDPANLFAFDEWEELRHTAHDMIDEQIDLMRIALTSTHGSYSNTARFRQQHDDVATLFAYLFSGIPLPTTDRALRERLRALARLVEIDFPRPTTTAEK